MSMLGRKEVENKIRCKVKMVKCKCCGKTMFVRTNRKHGGVVLAQNRVTCSKTCSTTYLRDQARKKAKEWRVKNASL